MTTVLFSIRPAPFTAWFHHLLTRPFIEIDGTERPAEWGSQTVTVRSGPHRINVYFRYRMQQRTRLAESGKDLTLPDTARRVQLRARLGIRNGSTFRIDGPVTGR